MLWYSEGECVGISDGSYSFASGSYPFTSGNGDVMGKIADMNAARPCQTTGSQSPVTLGAMLTMTSLNAGYRAVHELEGIAAAFNQATQPTGDLSSGCAHPIKLLVAQMGANEQAAVQDAKMLAADDVSAVVGMGLSSQQSADAASVLNADQIPMVADVMTAEGFDRYGSRGDGANYSDCAAPTPTADYENGLGPFFFRVSSRAKVQVQAALTYMAAAPKAQAYFVVQPTITTDPYTCTTLPLIVNGLAQQGVTTSNQDMFPMDFDLTHPAQTQDSAATEICEKSGPVTVYYAARAVYLSTLLDDIITAKRNSACNPSSITLVSESDAAQLRITAPNDSLEEVRQAVVGSPQFEDGWLRIYYTPLADPDLLRGSQPPGFQDIKHSFSALGFGASDLDDGWAIMGYDAFATVAAAIKPLGGQITGAAIQAQIQDTLIQGTQTPVPGADGPITFDGQGNRVGHGSGMVRLCPGGGPPGDPLSTVAVTGASQASCP